MALRPEVVREARGVLRELVQHHLAELRKNAVLGYGADGGDTGGDMAMSAQASAPCPDCGGAHPPGAAHLVKDAAGGQACPDCGGRVEELGGVGGTDFYYCTGCGGALQRVADSGTAFQPVAGLNSVEKAGPYKGTIEVTGARVGRAINTSDKAGYTGMKGGKGGLADNPRFQAANRRYGALLAQRPKPTLPDGHYARGEDATGNVAKGTYPAAPVKKDASSPPPQRGPNGMFPPGSVSSYVASIPHGGSHASRKADRVASAAEAHAARVRSKIPRTAAGATTHRVRTGDVRTVGAASPHLAAAHAADAAADQAHSAAMATKAEPMAKADANVVHPDESTAVVHAERTHGSPLTWRRNQNGVHGYAGAQGEHMASVGKKPEGGFSVTMHGRSLHDDAQMRAYRTDKIMGKAESKPFTPRDKAVFRNSPHRGNVSNMTNEELEGEQFAAGRSNEQLIAAAKQPKPTPGSPAQEKAPVAKAGLTSPAAPAAPKGAPAPKPAAAAPPKPPMMAGIGKSAAAPAPRKYSLVPGVRRSFKVQPGSSTPAVAPKK